MLRLTMYTIGAGPGHSKERQAERLGNEEQHFGNASVTQDQTGGVFQTLCQYAVRDCYIFCVNCWAPRQSLSMWNIRARVAGFLSPAPCNAAPLLGLAVGPPAVG